MHATLHKSIYSAGDKLKRAVITNNAAASGYFTTEAVGVCVCIEKKIYEKTFLFRLPTPHAHTLGLPERKAFGGDGRQSEIRNAMQFSSLHSVLLGQGKLV